MKKIVSFVVLFASLACAEANTCALDEYILNTFVRLKQLYKAAQRETTEYDFVPFDGDVILQISDVSRNFLDSIAKINPEENTGFCYDSTVLTLSKKVNDVARGNYLISKYFFDEYLGDEALSNEDVQAINVIYDYIMIKYGQGLMRHRDAVGNNFVGGGLIVEKDFFAKHYSESRFNPLFDAWITQKFIDEVRDVTLLREKRIRFGLALLGGLALTSSPLKSMNSSFSSSFISGRLQYGRLLTLVQVDLWLKDENHDATGTDFLEGVAIVNNSALTVDVLAGVGFMEYHVKEDTVTSFNPVFGAQVDKHFYIGDVLSFFIRAQWLFKMNFMEDLEKDQDVMGVSLDFRVGLGISANMPTGNMTKGYFAKGRKR